MAPAPLNPDFEQTLTLKDLHNRAVLYARQRDYEQEEPNSYTTR